MQHLTLKDVLRLVDRAVQAVDHRLSGHGEQVAHVLSAILAEEGRSQQEIQLACMAAMFHDLGAYKIEERQRLEEFEVSDPHGHAVYGSLFVQHYAPFPELARGACAGDGLCPALGRPHLPPGPADAL